MSSNWQPPPAQIAAWREEAAGLAAEAARLRRSATEQWELEHARYLAGEAALLRRLTGDETAARPAAQRPPITVTFGGGEAGDYGGGSIEVYVDGARIGEIYREPGQEAWAGNAEIELRLGAPFDGVASRAHTQRTLAAALRRAHRAGRLNLTDDPEVLDRR